jgi:hypothetical protein
MKKILFVALAMVIANQAMAQQADTVYVAFTPTESEAQGVWEWIFDEEDDDPYDYYRSPVRDYTLFNRSENYFFELVYVNRNTEPAEYILLRPLSFLDTVEYIDWDVIGPTLTKAQAEELMAEILSHDKIYFIPRNPSSGNSSLPQLIDLVPVEIPRSLINEEILED